MKKTLVVLIVLSLLTLTAACLVKDKTATVTLYYTNKDNSQILTETREVKLSREQTLPQLAVGELLKGPKTEGLKSTIPKGTKLLNVEVKDKIATVNLSKDFSGFPG